MAQSWYYKPAIELLDVVLPLDKPAVWRTWLPRLMVWITGKPRYFPKVQWASNDFTYDVFRAYELIFGKPYGVKLTSQGEVYADAASPTGFFVRNKKFYTLEARLADWEGALRYDIKATYRKLRAHSVIQNPILAYSLASLLAVLSKASFGTLPLIVGAVTFGLVDDGSHLTFNAGGTGAVLVVEFGETVGNTSTFTYGGSNLTNVISPVARCWGGAGSYEYFLQLTNPPSGSNTLNPGGGYATFTGIDSTNSTSGVNTGNATTCGTSATSIATTTTRDGCMMFAGTNGGALPSIATNSILDTVDFTSGGHNYILHSSATFTAQTVTSTVSNAASGMAYQVAVQPPATVVKSGFFFAATR